MKRINKVIALNLLGVLLIGILIFKSVRLNASRAVYLKKLKRFTKMDIPAGSKDGVAYNLVQFNRIQCISIPLWMESIGF